MSRGQVRTQGLGDSHPSSPIPLPSALNSRFQRSDTSPSLNSLKNRVQRRRRFLCPHAWYPCPSPAKHHAPHSLRFPANLQAPLGDLSPRHPPNPRLQLPVPWSAGRSPAARLAVARRRGRAAGRGQRTARGARFANLRRRSPRYVYLGRLTPALPAGSGRALARAPVGRPGWFGTLRRERPRGLQLRGEGEAARTLWARRAREWVGRGRRRCPCSPSPALAPPPPGGAPTAATHRPAGPRGRAREI